MKMEVLTELTRANDRIEVLERVLEQLIDIFEDTYEHEGSYFNVEYTIGDAIEDAKSTLYNETYEE
jgi:hypothetical protein